MKKLSVFTLIIVLGLIWISQLEPKISLSDYDLYGSYQIQSGEYEIEGFIKDFNNDGKIDIYDNHIELITTFPQKGDIKPPYPQLKGDTYEVRIMEGDDEQFMIQTIHGKAKIILPESWEKPIELRWGRTNDYSIFLFPN